MPGRSVEEHRITLEKDLIAAQKRRDFSAIEALLADGFCEIGSSGRFFSRAQALDASRKYRTSISSSKTSASSRLPLDASSSPTLPQENGASGAEYSTRAFRSSTWVNQQGAWRTVFHQATHLPPLE